MKDPTPRDIDGDLWRALVQSSPDVLLVIELDATISYLNRIVPFFSNAPVVGRKIWEFAEGPSPKERILGVIGRIVESREALVYEHPGKIETGPGWYEVRAIPVVEDGRVVRIIWASRDITQRKLAEEANAHQSELLASVNQPIIATDGAGCITYWNEPTERLYGYKAADVMGRDSAQLLQTRWLNPGGYEAFLASVLATGAWQGELLNRTASGEDVVVDVSLKIRRNAEGIPVAGIAVIQDLTERRRLEEQLRQSQKMEAIGLLAGGVAHDFNNLLAVILGFSELASRKLPPGHPVSEQLSEVFDAARRGSELTRKLLAFSRKQILQSRPLDLGAQIADFTRLLSRILGEDVEVEIEPPPATLVVKADSVQLEQVLLNLCTNARQAMPKGGQLRLAMRAETFDVGRLRREPWARSGRYAELSVTDTGVGMDEATRLRVFEPFFTTKPEGSGLGLATVYGIVRQHGGFVHVDSTPGQGTTFRVFLPLAGPDEAPPSPVTGTRSRDRALRGCETILLAEDEPSLRSLVSTTLGELGYRVVATVDGEAAVREYERLGPDAVSLVLLDVVMPRLDAREAYERICAIGKDKDVRVLFMTGYAPESTRLGELIEKAKVPLLEKPFTPEALAAKVRSILDGPRQR